MSIELHVNNRVTEIPVGTSLFDAATGLGIRVPTSCVKQGKCKECLVEVVEGMECLSARTPEERHLQGDFRLSCQARIASTSGVVRCHTLRRGEMRIEKQALNLPLRTGMLKLDPSVRREGERVLLDGREIDRTEQPLYGVAMDLGTTTIVMRLLDMETGDVLAESAFENPQMFGGSDIMSRIQYDSDHRGKLLQRTLAGYVTHAIEDFAVDPHSIYEMVVVGNSTMRDLFFRLNVHSIGQSPYQSITEHEVRLKKRPSTSLTSGAARLSLPIHPRARIYGAPIVSGHVGADAAACMLAIDIMHEERIVALMDIGTNTELIVGNKDRILAASCPAGPAFEGGKISCGMPGLPGAIEGVTIAVDGSMRFRTIGDVAAEGICGSGMIDLLAELLRTQQINHLGRLVSGEPEITLDTNGGSRIVFRESDINELAQAKGANVAGLCVVFDRFGIRFDEIDTFYLAGGFGRHVDVRSSKRIGLIPDIPDAKIVQVGNAAIEGACMALLSRTRRNELEETVRRVEHCRLETHPDFFNFFVEGCQFQPLESPRPIPSPSHLD